ncbi:MAG: hypothetical protein IJH70_02445 [Oscillospiraceae bacterium]|nr:hypothetical protein [Oscillospiraceae bacterium]
MKVVEAFKLPNDIGYCICFDRKLNAKEMACRTAVVDDLSLEMLQTTNDRWLWTKDNIPDPDALAGKEIILM